MKIQVFWHVSPCRLANTKWRHLPQARWVSSMCQLFWADHTVRCSKRLYQRTPFRKAFLLNVRRNLWLICVLLLPKFSAGFCYQWVVRYLQHVAAVIAIGSPNYPEDECTAILGNPRRVVSSALPLWDPQTSHHTVFMVVVYCLVPQDVAAVVQDWTHSHSLLPTACIVRQGCVSHCCRYERPFKCCLPAFLVALSANKYVVWLTDPWTEICETTDTSSTYRLSLLKGSYANSARHVQLTTCPSLRAMFRHYV
jgi:hypothetical protein